MDRWHAARLALAVAVLAALVGLSASWATSAIFDAFGPARQSESHTVPAADRPGPAPGPALESTPSQA